MAVWMWEAFGWVEQADWQIAATATLGRSRKITFMKLLQPLAEQSEIMFFQSFSFTFLH